MIIPAVVYYIVFCYLPMIGVVIAFKNYNYKQGVLFSPWAGFENFKYFFISGKAWSVTRNTIVFNLIFIITSTVICILIAIMLNEITNKFYKKITQSLLLLPYFISWVVTSIFFYNIFNYEHGVFNTIINSLGLASVNIYAKGSFWYLLLPMMNLWKGVGYGSIFYLAAIAGFDQEIYEAASIDGANILKRNRYITLPLLKPTIIILVLFSIGGILRGNFDMFFQLVGYNALLYKVTDIIDTLVFRSLISGADFGMAAASAFYQSVLCFVIITVTNGIVKKVQSEYALY
jgi:putative aldouronate transport system permease protein